MLSCHSQELFHVVVSEQAGWFELGLWCDHGLIDMGNLVLLADEMVSTYECIVKRGIPDTIVTPLASDLSSMLNKKMSGDTTEIILSKSKGFTIPTCLDTPGICALHTLR